MDDSGAERGRGRGTQARESTPAPSPAPSPPELRVRLASHVGSAARARALVGTALRRWRRTDLLDDALLVTSELVTNAVLHATGSDLEIIVRLVERSIRVEVRDDCERVPVPRASTAEETTGRGLALVDAVAVSWGVDTSKHGKRVWAEVG